MAIRNPVEWGVDQFRHAAFAVESAGRVGRRTRDNLHSPPPAVRHIRMVDLRDVLARGLDDFAAYRTDVIFLAVIYPVLGIVLARLAFGYGMLPLLFPLASGFALIGPFAALGLYEMSRRREQGLHVSWAHAVDVTHAPGFGAIMVLGLVLNLTGVPRPAFFSTVTRLLIWIGTALCGVAIGLWLRARRRR